MQTAAGSGSPTSTRSDMAEIARDRSSARIDCLVQVASQSDNACQCFTGLPATGLDEPAGKQAALGLDLADSSFPFFTDCTECFPVLGIVLRSVFGAARGSCAKLEIPMVATNHTVRKGF